MQALGTNTPYYIPGLGTSTPFRITIALRWRRVDAMQSHWNRIDDFCCKIKRSLRRWTRICVFVRGRCGRRFISCANYMAGQSRMDEQSQNRLNVQSVCAAFLRVLFAFRVFHFEVRVTNGAMIFSYGKNGVFKSISVKNGEIAGWRGSLEHRLSTIVRRLMSFRGNWYSYLWSILRYDVGGLGVVWV